jgi:hypothetical protein
MAIVALLAKGVSLRFIYTATVTMTFDLTLERMARWLCLIWLLLSCAAAATDSAAPRKPLLRGKLDFREMEIAPGQPQQTPLERSRTKTRRAVGPFDDG